MIKAIIFDADGPLYNRKPEVIEAQLALLNRFGYPQKLGHKQVAHLNKYGHLGSLHDFDVAYEREKTKAYVRDESVPVMVQHMLQAIGLDLSDRDLREFTLELTILHKSVSPAPDAIATLKRVKELGYHSCVLTDSYYSSSEKWGWFEAIGMGGLLEYMISSYDIRMLKDTPEAYWACLDVLKVGAREAIFVGHQQYEMIGAKAAGVTSVGIQSIAPSDIHPDYTIEYLRELPDLLEQLKRAN